MIPPVSALTETDMKPLTKEEREHIANTVAETVAQLESIPSNTATHAASVLRTIMRHVLPRYEATISELESRRSSPEGQTGPTTEQIAAVTDEEVGEMFDREALQEAEQYIASLRGPLLYYFGTTDPELLAEVWRSATVQESAGDDTKRLDFLIDWFGFNDDFDGSGIRDWDDNADARKAIDAAMSATVRPSSTANKE